MEVIHYLVILKITQPKMVCQDERDWMVRGYGLYYYKQHLHGDCEDSLKKTYPPNQETLLCRNPYGASK